MNGFGPGGANRGMPNPTGAPSLQDALRRNRIARNTNRPGGAARMAARKAMRKFRSMGR